MVEHPPTVTDADGKPAKLSEFPILAGLWLAQQAPLKPGEEFEMGTLQLSLAPAGTENVDRPTLFASPGKYRLHYEGLPLGYPNPTEFLSTGTLELEVKTKGDPKWR